MNSKFRPIYGTLSLLFAAFIFMNFNGNPPPARTQAPPASASTCASSGCHSSAGNFTGDVSVMGLPAEIMPNTTYTISVVVNNADGNATRAGFQLDIIDDSETSVGTLANPSTGSDIETNAGRTYFEHRTGQAFSANQASWSVEWTAPASVSGNNVQFWTVGNIANGNGGSSGDNVVFNMQSVDFSSAAPVSAMISASSDVSCNGGSDGSATVSASDGAPPYTYNWSNDATTTTVDNLIAGTYTVTVTDADMTTTTAEVSIAEPAALAPSIAEQVDINCITTTGSLTAMTNGGTPPYIYAWSNGAMGGTITDLVAGEYIVTVTDANNCTSILSSNITTNMDTPTVSIVPPPVIGCDEFILLNATASTSNGGVSFAWTTQTGAIISQENTAMPLISGAGFYYVTVSDNISGCTVVDSVLVENPESVMLVSTEQNNILCNGMANGDATVEVNGGVPPYNYAWSNGDTNMTATNLSAGTYTVTVTGNASCGFVIEEFTITEPEAITTMLEVSHETAMGANDGSVIITISGGTAPYDDAENGQITIDNLAPGNYENTITDANDCTAIVSFTINSFNCGSISSSISSTDVSCSNGEDGTASIVANNGTAPYTYNWSNGATEAMISSLLSGDYTVTVTDANNCETTNSVTINEPSPIVISDIEIMSATDGQSNGSVSVSISGGTETYTYAWILDGVVVSTDMNLSDVLAGVYTLQVTDSNGCIVTSDEITVDNLVGVDQIETVERLEVFPNPNDGQFVLSLTLSQTQDVQLSVLDMMGKQLMELAPERLLARDFQLDLTHMPSGVYWLKVVVAEDIIVRKIVIKE